MASTPGSVVIEFKPEDSWHAFELGFIEGSNPRAYNKLLGIASLNAVRTIVAPMKAAAPVRTGRLSRAVAAKAGRYSRPSATVGPRAGRSRADQKGAWYRWMVTSGHKTRLNTQSAGSWSGLTWAQIGAGQTLNKSRGGVSSVAARPFVTQTAESNQDKMIDAFYATVERYFNDSVFRHKLTKFKRR